MGLTPSSDAKPRMETKRRYYKKLANAVDRSYGTENCPICLMSGSEIKRLVCGHVFCMECISEWYCKRQALDRIAECPCCRHEIEDEELEKRWLARSESDEDSIPNDFYLCLCR